MIEEDLDPPERGLVGDSKEHLDLATAPSDDLECDLHACIHTSMLHVT